MKKLFVILAFAIVSCNTEGPDNSLQSEASKIDSAENREPYVYTATYADKFEMGDDKHSRIVLNVWKAFDNNALESVKNNFADSVYMRTRDGWEFYGSRDSMVILTNQYRSTLDSVSSEVAAFIPLKATANGDQWVSIWGKEVSITKGKTDSLDLHEIWRFNKDGKIDWMRQYGAVYQKK